MYTKFWKAHSMHNKIREHLLKRFFIFYICQDVNQLNAYINGFLKKASLFYFSETCLWACFLPNGAQTY